MKRTKILFFIFTLFFLSTDVFANPKGIVRILEETRVGRFYVTQTRSGVALVRRVLGKRIQSQADFADFISKLNLGSAEVKTLIEDLKIFNRRYFDLKRMRGVDASDAVFNRTFREFLSDENALVASFSSKSPELGGAAFFPSAISAKSLSLAGTRLSPARNEVLYELVFPELSSSATTAIKALEKSGKTKYEFAEGGPGVTSKQNSSLEFVDLVGNNGVKKRVMLDYDRITYKSQLDVQYSAVSSGSLFSLNLAHKGKKGYETYVRPEGASRTYVLGETSGYVRFDIPQVVKGHDALLRAENASRSVYEGPLAADSVLKVTVDGSVIELSHIGSKLARGTNGKSDVIKDFFANRVALEDGTFYDVFVVVKRKNSNPTGSVPEWSFDNSTSELIVRRPKTL